MGLFFFIVGNTCSRKDAKKIPDNFAPLRLGERKTAFTPAAALVIRPGR
jgi:hypothetical protein